MLLSSSMILFYFILFMGPLITISSSHWIICWVGLELSFLSLMPILLSNSQGGFSLNKEGTLKYFCVQALSSVMLFLAGLNILYDMSPIFSVLFALGISLKLGLFPGHFWVMSVVSVMEWLPCLLLLTWQKLPVLALLLLLTSINFSEMSYLFMVMGAISSVVGALLGLNSNNIRSVIGASSISHSGWLALSSQCGFMWMYYGLYSFVLVVSMGFLWTNHMLSGISMLSMSGLPPFIMFLAKWNVVLSAISSSVSFILILLLILGSLLSLMFYMKFTYAYYLNTKKNQLTLKSLPLISINIGGSFYILFFDGWEKR